MSGTVLAAVDVAHVEMQANVLSRARQLAELDGSKLAVMTVIPDFGMSIVGSFFDEKAESQALELARKRLHEIVAAGLGSDADIQHVIEHGNVYEKILATASSLDASLIVVGAHKPGLTDYLLGPNAARVVRHSTCSVYVIRE